ncbi:unnamed protein product [Adineta steineri]|uniref:G-protein coupled receptors family 1 profile domain-containing protein n=1 Tax=Adineta steineri TaxID=433720 RepID=A0A818VA81_9BILA|nr:unnamed protein product [Adineta steineri]CAF3708220.1 unnamed protein product [Adineta steineri]
MFKTKRKSQPPTTVPSSSSLSRTTLLVSSSSACSTRHHQNNKNKNVSLSSSTCISPQYNNYKKTQHQRRNEENISNIRLSRPKQFLGYFRCCCYHLCSCTCECSIPSNTFQNVNASTTFTRQNCAKSFIDFILSTDHLRSYISEHNLIEQKTTKIFIPKLTLFILLFLSLCPLTFATTLPPTEITTFNRHFYNFGDFDINSSSITFSLSQKPQWHAGCCMRSNNSFLSVCGKSFNLTFHNLSGENLFEKRYKIDFLNDEYLFCQRYNAFRNLSLKHLAMFTYFIVIIGIILNTFVFLVLMCGSLRRSTSFILFLALTCFDLLSLASSLFAQLFRTVMTYLKTSALFCKMFGIFFLYFRQCSSTTLLLIAIERCIVIKYPFCRHTFDKFRIPLLGFIMFIFIAPIPFDFIFYTTGPLHCEAFDTTNAQYYQIFRGFFTVFSYAMVPFVGISISNFLIIMELKKSKKRFMTKDENGTMRRFSTNVVDKRGTTVMLLVASFAFVLLLGPFYLHWCVAYLFYYYPQCQFTRNLYENVQVCMGVFHPYLTVIEKGMRESNHAINFLLYWATSTRFRMDFKRINRRIFFRIFGTTIIFLFKHICFCCTEPSCLVSLERHVSDTADMDSSYDYNRKNQAAYKTSHYYSNFERRRQHQLVKDTLLNSTIPTDTNLTPTASLHTLTANTAKTVRMLTWNPHDPMMRQLESRRQATRLSKRLSTSGAV